ncbi:MAG: Spy/CpxP family protein refolding chaperone [Gammaproteobacteria bacterium]|nr:Spy/CpxP family protein refolding chaperone [Gammaproteobacteria bacterium]
MTNQNVFFKSVYSVICLILLLSPAFVFADRHMGTMDGEYGRHGMMGMGYGIGPMGMISGGMGMMGFGPYGMLKLSEQQREKIRSIQLETRKEHLALMENIVEQHEKMHKLMNAEPRKTNDITKVFDEITKVQRSMVVSMIETMNKMDAVLDKDQRAELREYRNNDMGYGMMW